MAETKLVTLNGLKKFKELLDNSYSQKFAEKGQTVDDESDYYTFASDEEVENLLDDIFSSSQSTDKESDNETKGLLDDIFG